MKNEKEMKKIYEDAKKQLKDLEKFLNNFFKEHSINSYVYNNLAVIIQLLNNLYANDVKIEIFDKDNVIQIKLNL